MKLKNSFLWRLTEMRRARPAPKWGSRSPVARQQGAAYSWNSRAIARRRRNTQAEESKEQPNKSTHRPEQISCTSPRMFKFTDRNARIWEREQSMSSEREPAARLRDYLYFG